MTKKIIGELKIICPKCQKEILHDFKLVGTQQADGQAKWEKWCFACWNHIVNHNHSFEDDAFIYV